MFYKQFQIFIEFLKKRILSISLLVLLVISVFINHSYNQLRRQDLQKVVDLVMQDQEVIRIFLEDMQDESANFSIENENDYQTFYQAKIDKIEEFQLELITRSQTFPSIRKGDDLIRLKQNRQKYLLFLAEQSLQFYLENYNWHLANHTKLIETNQLADLQEGDKKSHKLKLTNQLLDLIESHKQNLNLDFNSDLKIRHLTKYDSVKEKAKELKIYLEKEAKDELSKENYRYITKEIFKDDLDIYFNYRFLTFNPAFLDFSELSNLENKVLTQTGRLKKQLE